MELIQHLRLQGAAGLPPPPGPESETRTWMHTCKSECAENNFFKRIKTVELFESVQRGGEISGIRAKDHAQDRNVRAESSYEEEQS